MITITDIHIRYRNGAYEIEVEGEASVALPQFLGSLTVQNRNSLVSHKDGRMLDMLYSARASHSHLTSPPRWIDLFERFRNREINEPYADTPGSVVRMDDAGVTGR